MAKNTFAEWSPTPSENTDIGGISILGSSAVSNFDDALRRMMAQLAVGVPIAATGVDPEFLVASYTAAQLNGTSQVVLDLPTGFSTFRLLIETVASAAQATLVVRCGPAGGALNTGASAYSFLVTGLEGSSVVNATGTDSAGILGTIGSSGNTIIEAVICDGSAGGVWKAKISEFGTNAGGLLRNADRSVLFSSAGAQKRLGIISPQPFQNFGSIKIYGVRP